MMKKLICMILWLIMSCNVIVVHAVDSETSNDYALNLDITDIKKIAWVAAGGQGRPLVETGAYRRSHYHYNTSDERELQYIVFMLNDLKFIDDGEKRTFADYPYIDIYVTKSNGDVDRFGVEAWRLGRNGKQYGMDADCQIKFDCINEFVYALKTKGHFLDGEVTFEPSEWAKEDVDESIEAGLLPEWNRIGYTLDIPRVEVCQLIDNMLTVKEADKELSADFENPFDDTDDIAVWRLYSQGIVDGKSDTEFCPYDMITREEFARVLANSYSVISTGTPSTKSGASEYADTAQISDWAKDDVETVSDLGLMQGDEKGCFNPQEHITKEEVIVTLLRLYEQVQ